MADIPSLTHQGQASSSCRADIYDQQNVLEEHINGEGEGGFLHPCGIGKCYQLFLEKCVKDS